MIERFNKLLEQLEDGLILEWEYVKELEFMIGTHKCTEENSNADN